MTIHVSSRAHRAVVLRLLAAAVLMCPAATFAGPSDEPVAVIVDQAKIIRLPEKVATIVVGNPLIADVSLQPGGMVVVTGKGYGSTNMIAMDRAGGLVSQFRRRGQIDQRLDQLARHETELEEQDRELTDRQFLPVGVLGGLGAMFVVGVTLVLAGLLTPGLGMGSVGWALALLGLAGVGAAVGVKLLLERSNARRLDACRKQLDVLRSQVQLAKEERDGLDARLPGGGGHCMG